ncbi:MULTISPECIES: recombinase family protein [unclassified Streptomyces]|uniref:recombinase family protein n=1 Tax=unclassified Streptomyces TaxID=2593676 RepID=UPI0035D5DF6D
MTLYVPTQLHRPPDPGGPWLGYIRVSTWKEELISPELQEAAIRGWAARTGRRLIEPMIVDLDATGRNFNRKIMGVIERVERREAAGICVWRYSRFGRNRTGNAANLARLEAVGGELESATEPVDARTAVGELQREMIFAFGNYESNRAGEQWRETHEYRIKNQLPATGRPRFGYIWHPRRVPDLSASGGWRLQQEHYSLHPDFASVAEELFDLKLAPDPAGFAQLAHWLNVEMNAPTVAGGRWHASGISRYMDSGFAAGLLRVHDRQCRCGYARLPGVNTCQNNRMIFVPGAQPKIIQPDVWEAYKAQRARTKATPPRARKATYTLSGIGRHGSCRSHLSHASYRTDDKQQVRGYWLVCGLNKSATKSACIGVNVKREQVEKDVREWLAREIAEDVDALLVDVRGATSSADPKVSAVRERARLNAELKRVDAAMDRLVMDNAMNPDKYPADAFTRVRDKLMEEKKSLTGQLGRIGEVGALPVKEDYRELLVGLLAEWDTFLPIERNSMLQQVIRRVVCYDTRNADGVLLSVRTEIHPVWELDPWERKRICLGDLRPVPGWDPANLWTGPSPVTA